MVRTNKDYSDNRSSSKGIDTFGLREVIMAIQPILYSFSAEQAKLQDILGPSLEEFAARAARLSSAAKIDEETAKRLNDIFEVNGELKNEVSSLTQSFLDSSRGLSDALTNVFESISKTVDYLPKITILSQGELQAVEATATNWSSHLIPFPIGASPSEINRSFSSQKEADAFFDEFTKGDDCLALENRLLSIKSVPLQNIQECLEDFGSNKYTSCMFFLLSFIDNILITSQKRKRPQDRVKLPSQINGLLKESDFQYIPMYSLMLKTYQLCIKKIYEYGYNFEQEHIVVPNRNYIDHGMGSYSATKRDCLKVMTLVIYSMLFFG